MKTFAVTALIAVVLTPGIVLAQDMASTPGIASRYANDRGIEDDPAVVFVETWNREASGPCQNA